MSRVESDPGSTPVGGLPCLREGDGQALLGRCETLRGDVDRDGDVDLEDRSLLVARFGLRAGDPAWLEAADLDGDESVTLLDYRHWLDARQAYEAPPPPPVAADGASGAVLCGLIGLEPLALTLLVLLRRRPALRRNPETSRATPPGPVETQLGARS